MYDSMLNFGSKERVPSGDDAQLFLRSDKSQPEKLQYPQVRFSITSLNSSANSVFIYTEANSGLWVENSGFQVSWLGGEGEGGETEAGGDDG